MWVQDGPLKRRVIRVVGAPDDELGQGPEVAFDPLPVAGVGGGWPPGRRGFFGPTAGCRGPVRGEVVHHQVDPDVWCGPGPAPPWRRCRGRPCGVSRPGTWTGPWRCRQGPSPPPNVFGRPTSGTERRGSTRSGRVRCTLLTAG